MEKENKKLIPFIPPFPLKKPYSRILNPFSTKLMKDIMLRFSLTDRQAVEKLTRCLEVIGTTFFKNITQSNQPFWEPFSKTKIMQESFLEQSIMSSVNFPTVENILKFTVLFFNSTTNTWWIYLRKTEQKWIRKWLFMKARMMAYM